MSGAWSHSPIDCGLFGGCRAQFSTYCTGNCDSGWTAQGPCGFGVCVWPILLTPLRPRPDMTGNKLDAGGGLGSYVVSVLTTTVTYYTTGEIRFTYGLIESKCAKKKTPRDPTLARTSH